MSYLNVDEVDTAVVNLASAHPALCQLVTLPNQTIEGRTCHAVRLGGGFDFDDLLIQRTNEGTAQRRR